MLVSFSTMVLVALVAFLIALGLGFIMALRAIHALEKQHLNSCKNCERRVAEFARNK